MTLTAYLYLGRKLVPDKCIELGSDLPAEARIFAEEPIGKHFGDLDDLTNSVVSFEVLYSRCDFVCLIKVLRIILSIGAQRFGMKVFEHSVVPLEDRFSGDAQGLFEPLPSTLVDPTANGGFIDIDGGCDLPGRSIEPGKKIFGPLFALLRGQVVIHVIVFKEVVM